MGNKTVLGKKKLVFVSIVVLALICNIGASKGVVLNPDTQKTNSIELGTTTVHLGESQEYSSGGTWYVTDVAGLIKSGIETKQVDIIYFLRQNPDLIDKISEVIKEKISAKPELLGDVEKLTTEIKVEITSHKLQSSIQISSMETMGLDWYDIIMYILKMFLPAKPNIDVDYIGSQCEKITIRFTVDNAEKVYAITILSDGKIVGHVEDGWFTWPGNSKTFTLEYNDMGRHKIEAYPTILKGIPQLRTIFTSSLPVYIGSGNYYILPELKVTKIQPISIKVIPVPIEIGNIYEINSPVLAVLPPVTIPIDKTITITVDKIPIGKFCNATDSITTHDITDSYKIYTPYRFPIYPLTVKK